MTVTSALIFGHDENGIISGGFDKSVRIWGNNKEAGRFYLNQTLQGHKDVVDSLDLSVDGSLLISGARDHTVRLWVAERKGGYRELQTLKGHEKGILSVAVSQDKDTIVSGSEDKTVRVWTRDHYSQLFTQSQVLEGHKEAILSVKIIPDGNTIYSGSADQTVGVWKLNGQWYQLVASFGMEQKFEQIILMKNRFMIVHKNLGAIIKLVSPSMKHFFSYFSQKYRLASTLNKALKENENKDALQILVDQLPRYEKAQQKKNAEQLIILHTQINPLFWFCLFESSTYLRKALQIWHYEQWVYHDCRQFDPFIFSFESGNQELITVWAEYFEENPERLRIKDQETFNDLLGCDNKDMENFAISKFKVSSALTDGAHPTAMYPLDEDKGFEVVKSNQPYKTSKIEDKFIKQKNSSKPSTRVSEESTSIALYQSLSKLLIFLKRVKKLTPENKMKVRPVIISIFKMYHWVFLTYSIFNLTSQVLLFLIVIFQEQAWYYVIPFYLIYSGMLINELIDFASQRFAYFTIIYNWFDILLYPAGMGLVTYLLSKKYEFLDDQLNNFLVSLLLYLALTRAVSMLRVFDSTRYLIQMIMMVYYDMTPFASVLGFYIIGIGALNILWSTTNPEDSEQPKYSLTWDHLRLSSDVIYNWGYGNWEGNGGMNALNFWFYIHTGVFIGLIMFNLLIAIISGTYERFTEDRVRVDLEQVIDMLLEMAEFLRFLRYIREKLFGVTQSKKVYFHFLVSSEEAGDIQEIAEKIEALEHGFKHNQANIEEKLIKMEQNLMSVESNQIKMEKKIEQNQKEIKETINQIFDLMKKQTTDKGDKNQI